MSLLRRILIRLLNTRFATKVVIGLTLFVFITLQLGLIKPFLEDRDSPYSETEGFLNIFGPKQPTEERNFPINYTSPWTWICGEDGKCHRNLRGTGEILSLESCWLTCGTYRTLWPQPKVKGDVETVLGYDTVQLSFEHLTLIQLTTVSDKVHKMAEDAFHIFRENVGKLIPKAYIKNEDVHGVVAVSIDIITDEDYLTLVTDEHYNLIIEEQATHTLSVTISGETFFGVRHGLETLSQLIIFDDIVHALKILKEVRLHDGPAFPYRGLMIDTARNFISVKSLQRIVDGMAANKLNVLHWHLTDSNSFPLFCPSYPQMTDYGAYSKDEIYTPEEVKEFIQYALLRGVKVIPEIDAPSHAGNGWQWGNAQNGYGELALHVNDEPFGTRCGQPPCGQLNPANPKVYEVLGGIYRDTLDTFDTDIFHMGGDEVSYLSWNTSEISGFMIKHKLVHPVMLRLYFQRRVRTLLKMMAQKSTTSHKNPIPVVWTSDLTSFLTQVTNHGMNATDYIIQLWEGVPLDTQDVRDLLDANYPVIISNRDLLYLDWGGGSWLQTDNSQYINWQTLYEINFMALGYNTTKRVVNAVLGEIPQVLGAEAPLWTEKVNEENVDARLWPRGAALAERLWLNPAAEHINHSLVHARLLHQNEVMRRRGIRVSAEQPKSCFLIDGSCEHLVEPTTSTAQEAELQLEFVSSPAPSAASTPQPAVAATSTPPTLSAATSPTITPVPATT